MAMDMLATVYRLWEHAVWADTALLRAVTSAGRPVPGALRELAHVIGTEETWLARLEQRTPRAAVWPDVSAREAETLAARTHQAYGTYLAGLREEDLPGSVPYTNSAGRQFTSSVGDILLHVALHGQYHRGKVNLLLRQAGCEPAPVDYIAFVRGAPAATEADSRGTCSGDA